MTDLADRPPNVCPNEPIKTNSTDECVEKEIESDESVSKKSESLTSCSGSGSMDDSTEFIQMPQQPYFDELPRCGSLSPICNEPISLFNLSISPISSVEDLTRANDKRDVYFGNINSDIENYAKEWSTNSYTDPDDYPENERISLDEIQAQINTPPSALSKTNKRLNLETIFEDVFLETPKKKRLNQIVRFNSWRIETFREITNEERIASYLFEQQQNSADPCPDTTNILCDEFDDKINL